MVSLILNSLPKDSSESTTHHTEKNLFWKDRTFHLPEEYINTEQTHNQMSRECDWRTDHARVSESGF